MKKLYKDGCECMADDEQVEILASGGWSAEEPKEEPVEDVSETETEEKVEAPAPKKIPRKRIKKSEE